MTLDLLEKMRAKRAALGQPVTAPIASDPSTLDDATAAPCPTCHGVEFWQDSYRHLFCLACQPPKLQAMIRRLLIATPDGWEQPIPRVTGLDEWFESLPAPPDPSVKPPATGEAPCRWCGGRRFHRAQAASRFGPVITCLNCHPIPPPPAAECFELPGAPALAPPDALALWVRALRPSVIPAGLRLHRWATIANPAQLVRWLQAAIAGGPASAEARRTAARLKTALTEHQSTIHGQSWPSNPGPPKTG